MNCNAIVIWWYENSSNALLPSMFEEKYVITLSFTLMEYIKNGNWIEFNNIMLDTLIFTRRMVVIFGYCIYNFSYGQDRHTSIIYFKTIMELKRQRKRGVTIFYMNLSWWRVEHKFRDNHVFVQKYNRQLGTYLIDWPQNNSVKIHVI